MPICCYGSDGSAAAGNSLKCELLQIKKKKKRISEIIRSFVTEHCCVVCIYMLFYYRVDMKRGPPPALWKRWWLYIHVS